MRGRDMGMGFSFGWVGVGCGVAMGIECGCRAKSVDGWVGSGYSMAWGKTILFSRLRRCTVVFIGVAYAARFYI